jgi:DNA-binding HxlR family transcriptional regulator
MSREYGQFCPVAKAAEVFCERWTPLIIRDLTWGARRFSELQRGVPLMSPTLLSHRLKQLEAEGIVDRRTLPDGKGVGYVLTEAGEEFAPVIQALGVWGQRWSRRQLEEGEIDLGLLIWAMERSVKPDAFGHGRTTVRLEFPDQPPEVRLWWFVNDGGSVQLCLSDPGYEVDLYLTVTLPDMIYIIRGDITPARAIENGRLEIFGPPAMRAALTDWLNLSPLAKVPSKRRDAPAEYPFGI